MRPGTTILLGVLLLIIIGAAVLQLVILAYVGSFSLRCERPHVGTELLVILLMAGRRAAPSGTSYT